MKLIIKNLKQIPYEVEVKDDKITINELKLEIEKVHNFEASNLKLLFNGMVLDNGKTLENYQIKDENILIMMNARVKPKNIPQQEPPKEEKKEDKKEIQQPQPQSQPKPQVPKIEKNYTKEVNSLIEMGFEKNEAEAAIKASKGNVELAIEFLYNGIPENLPEENLAPQEPNNDQPEVRELKKIASIIKVICAQQPNALEGILSSIENQDPQLMEILTQHEDEFKAMLAEPLTDNDIRNFQEFQENAQRGSGGMEGRRGRNPPGTIELTKEEFEAVKRLRELGNFSDAEIVQAYFACEKNEEMAINLLFENKMNEDNQGFNVNVIDNPHPQPNQPLSSSQPQIMQQVPSQISQQNIPHPGQLSDEQLGNIFSSLSSMLSGQNQPQSHPQTQQQNQQQPQNLSQPQNQPQQQNQQNNPQTSNQTSNKPNEEEKK